MAFWQLTTVQFEPSNLPARFGFHTSPTGPAPSIAFDGPPALLGSVERFFGILIEQLLGRLQLFLAPVQVEVCPVSEKVADTPSTSLET